MFEKQKAPALTAFYRCRVQVDLKEKFIVPIKGTLTKIRAGEIDKKTNGPFLIQCCFDVKTLPVIAIKPTVTQVNTPAFNVVPPHVIDYQSQLNSIEVEHISVKWVRKIPIEFEIVMDDNRNIFIDKLKENWVDVLRYVDILYKKLIYRLHNFLRLRLPMNRKDLFPGRHWVWDSFKVKARKIAAIMIVNGHIVDLGKLEYRNKDENLLNYVNSFSTLNPADEHSDLDGSYVVVDTTRSTVIRSGAAEVGIMRRWKEHTVCSMLTDHNHRTNKFYSSYPNQTVVDKELLSATNVKGTFQDLSVRIGCGMRRTNKYNIIHLFDWNEIENKELGCLKGNSNRQTIDDKRYRHLCYMFELAYALAIEPSKNISTSAGCEWQTGYFGK